MRGDMRAALDLVLATLGADPVSESVVQLLIELHFVRANASAAKRTYLEFYERSMDVLGVEPWEELQAMVAPLISGRRPGRPSQRLRMRGWWEWVG